MLRPIRSVALCVIYFIGLSLAQDTTSFVPSNTVATVADTTETTVAGTATLVSGATVGAATQTVTSLLNVPSYSFATSTLASSAAASLQSLIPSYSYNLTEESNSTRTSICNQQVQYCQTASCNVPTANVSTNFCNPQTMGWNCQCSSGDSRLLSYEAPVNLFDCQLRTGVCSEACQNPSATPAVTNIGGCIDACNSLIGQTCGQPDQIMVNYQVSSYSDTPSYAGNTLMGGQATRSAATVIGAATLLSLIAGATFVLSHVAS